MLERTITLATWLIVLSLSPSVSPPSSRGVPWDAAGAESLNVSVLGYYEIPAAGWIWGCAGYAAPSRHEYGFVGADSLHVVNLSDPTSPRRVTVLPLARPPADNYCIHISIWDHYAHAAHRYGPIVILDLDDPESPLVVGEIASIEFCACSCGHPWDDQTNPY